MRFNENKLPKTCAVVKLNAMTKASLFLLPLLAIIPPAYIVEPQYSRSLRDTPCSVLI